MYTTMSLSLLVPIHRARCVGGNRHFFLFNYYAVAAAAHRRTAFSHFIQSNEFLFAEVEFTNYVYGAAQLAICDDVQDYAVICAPSTQYSFVRTMLQREINNCKAQLTAIK